MTVSLLNRDFIAGFQRGRYESVRELHNMYFATLVDFAGQLTRNKAEAHQIVLETFIKLFSMREQFNNMPNIKAFLYITVRNICFTYIRAENPESFAGNTDWFSGIQDTANRFNDEAARKAAIDKIFDEVSRLPEDCVYIFKQIFYRRLSIPVVAEQLGVGPVNVAKQRNKAIQLLRDQLVAAGLFAVPLFVYFLTVEASNGNRQ